MFTQETAVPVRARRADRARGGVRLRRAQGVPVRRLRHLRVRRPDTPDTATCTHRYLVRVEEMRQSVRICRQALERISPTGEYEVNDPRVVPPPKDKVYTEMEALIQHFLIYSQGFTVPKGEAYVPVEGPRGEHGVYVVSDGTNRPARVHLRPASLLRVPGTAATMVVGGLIADVIAVIGSIDVVMGDVDR